MKFQFYSCSLLQNWCCPVGRGHKHNEVHFALFGRDVINNEVVAVTFRYCPYIVVSSRDIARQIEHTHCDVLQRKPLLGHADMTVYRLYVPMKSEFDRVQKAYKANAIEILDSHQTLELQLKLVLGLKPLDLICIEGPLATHKHTTVQREYHIPVRLTAATRKHFPLAVTNQSDFCTEPTIMSFDIEAYSDSGAFPTPSNSHTISICYALRTIQGKLINEKKLVLKDTERTLLLEFRDEIVTLDPDLITGWNTHGFDWPYLLERAKRVEATAFPYLDRLTHHKIEMWGYCYKKPTFVARTACDALHTVRTYKERIALNNTNKPESYALNYIAQLCLGRGKVDLSIPDMRRAYEKGDLNTVAEYCLVDAQLPLDILEHEGLCIQLFQVASISGASLQQAFQMTNSSLVIASLAHTIHEQDYVYNLPKVDKQGKFQGAFVFDPRAGLYSVLAILDFAALYPSIIIGYNMCYTTLIDAPELDSTTVDLPGDRQAHFTNQKPGLLPSALLAFMHERARVKKLMQTHRKGSIAYQTLDSRQQAIKTVNNSFYGLLGSSLSFGLEIIAESVTSFGRSAVQRTQRYLENAEYPVRLMDTDSCGIELPASLSPDEVSAVCTAVARDISNDVFEGKLTLEYEKQLRPCLIFKKKMYVGYDPSTDDLLIKGLSAKRRNIMPFVRETFQHVLQLLCHYGNADGALTYVRRRFQYLLEIRGTKLEDFAITSSIKHRLEYKGTPSLGYRVNQKLPWPLGPGERISYVYYYDMSDPKHNGSKRQGNWLPGSAIDTTLPLEMMLNHSIDVYKVLVQHERELRQYFRAVSVKHSNLFDRLYRETAMSIRVGRGCSKFKNYDIKFLNYP